MLDVESASPFLLERGLIDVDAIISGELVIRSAARRNRNLRAETADGDGYIIKQPDEPLQDGHRTLRSEAAFYAFCQGEPAASSVAGIMPRLADFDPEHAVLAIELLKGTVPLWLHYHAHEAPEFPSDVCRRLGHALGTVHRVFSQPALAHDHRLAWMHRAEPWIMQVHKPRPEHLATLSAGNYQTLCILQSQQGLGEALDRVRLLWRPETVIHGDIRADNVLVRPGSESAPADVRIVDWELVQFGDSAWDLAGALQDFVLFWTTSMPVSADLTAEERAAQARYPLSVLQGAMRALWHGYRGAARMAPTEADERLQRAVRFSAARLIQSAYELSQDLDGLSAQSVLVLQISANLLAEPELGQIQLYGIPRGSLPR